MPSVACIVRYGASLDDSESLEWLMRDADAPAAGEVIKPAVQVAVTTCKSCKKSFVAAGGEQVPIDNKTADYLTCDSRNRDCDALSTGAKPSIAAPDAVPANGFAIEPWSARRSLNSLNGNAAAAAEASSRDRGCESP